MPIRRTLSAVAVLAFALVSESAPLRAEVPDVAADIAPVHALVARVMQGVGSPALIIDPNASPHGYALRPSEAAALQAADLVVWTGAALTPWFGETLGKLAPDAKSLELLDLPETRRLPFREGLTFAAADGDEDHGHDDHGHDDHGHDDHEDQNDHAAHDEHGHAHAGTDPHAWLDPANARGWLEAIARHLSELDPDNAATYAVNAQAARQELRLLEAEITARLAPLSGLRYLVAHDAYQYFETQFGLRPAGAVALGDAADPGPARVAALRDMVRARGIACIFTEPQFRPTVIDRVFGGVAHHGILDPLGSGHDPGPGLYPALLRDMADALTACAEAAG